MFQELVSITDCLKVRLHNKYYTYAGHASLTRNVTQATRRFSADGHGYLGMRLCSNVPETRALDMYSTVYDVLHEFKFNSDSEGLINPEKGIGTFIAIGISHDTSMHDFHPILVAEIF